ncbi:MAG: hypothetical protein ACREOU_02240 [Candidatus Eiseniibacteriota bacterium]
MSRHPKNVFQSPVATAAAIVLFAGSLAGCGSMTSAPLAPESAATAVAVSTHGVGGSILPVDDPTIGKAPVIVPDVVIDLPDELDPVDSGGGRGGSPVVRGTQVDGATGGSLTSGRWTVSIPANAFSGTAQVQVSSPSPRSWRCQLSFSPGDKNNFAEPVMLTVDCHNIPPPRMRDYMILYFNPTTSAWEPIVGSTVNVRNKTVSAPLYHFSNTYALGTVDGPAGP